MNGCTFTARSRDVCANALLPLKRVDRPHRVDMVELLAPLPRPRRNVLCIGKNYHEHVHEIARAGFDTTGGGTAPPEAPIVFSKFPECVIGPGAPILHDRRVTAQLDYEAELAVIIGRRGRAIAPADAEARFVDVLRRLGQWDVVCARLDLRRRLLDPLDPRGLELDLDRAELLIEPLARAADAIALCDAVREANPRHPRAREVLERALRAAGADARLVKVLEERAALELDRERKALLDMERAVLFEQRLHSVPDAQTVLAEIAASGSAVAADAERKLERMLEDAGDWDGLAERISSGLGSGDVARDVEIRFSGTAVIRNVEVVGYDDAKGKRETKRGLEDVFGGEKRSVLLRMEVDAPPSGQVDLGQVTVNYKTVKGGEAKSFSQQLAVNATTDKAAVNRARNKDASAQAALAESDRIRDELLEIRENFGDPRRTQIIDDAAGKTLVSASSLDGELKAAIGKGADKAAASKVGKALAERALKAGIKDVVFDRGGYIYHGRVKALADAAREGGLNF